MAKATQTQRVLDYIRQFGSITAIDAVRDLGVMRLAARISDLKKEGYDIIICSPVSTDTVVELKASAEGLPIVFFNSCTIIKV